MVEGPAPFQGTRAQAEANLDSHNWRRTPDGTLVCFVCDAKPWHQGARYPCGQAPPRVEYDPRNPTTAPKPAPTIRLVPPPQPGEDDWRWEPPVDDH